MTKNEILKEEEENIFYVEKLLKKTGKMFRILYKLEKTIDYSFSYTYLLNKLTKQKLRPYKNREEFKDIKLSLPKVLFIEDLFEKYQNEKELSLKEIFIKIIFELNEDFDKPEIKSMYKSVALFYFDNQINRMKKGLSKLKEKILNH